MSKYIDAVGLKIKLGKRLSDDESRIMEIVKETIDSIPAIDIVHCKDCKWWTKQSHSIQGRCELGGILYPTGGWFCANGERKDNE